MNLYLMGYRGTGKSTIARLVAERVGAAWIDADREIEGRAGRTIAEIFRDSGEPAFRELEAQVVAELAGRSDLVVSLGGGAILRDENRRALRASGRCIWLTAQPQTIAQRLAADAATAGQRPSLTPLGTLAEIETVLAARTPLYRDLASFTIATDDQPPEKIAAIVARMWGLGRTAD